MLIRRFLHSCLYVFAIPLLFSNCKKKVDDIVEPPITNPEPTINPEDTAVALYISSSSNKLIALNAQDGSTKWIADLGAPLYSSPIYSHGKIYVGCTDNKLYCYDSSGTFKWSAPAPNDSAGHQCPVVANNTVYFPGSDAIYAFNAETGSLVWKTSGGSTHVIFKNNTIYTNNNYLSALDAGTGNLKWQYHTASTLPPVVFNDRIYVINHVPSQSPDSLCVINPQTGTLIWGVDNHDIFGSAIGLNVKYGNVYCMTFIDSHTLITATWGLNFLDSATGKIKFPTQYYEDFQTYSDYVRPIFEDSIAFLVSDKYNNLGMFKALTGEGINLPIFGLNPGPQELTVVNHILYFATRNWDKGDGYEAGTVYALDYRTVTLAHNPKGYTFKWATEFKNVDFEFQLHAWLLSPEKFIEAML